MMMNFPEHLLVKESDIRESDVLIGSGERSVTVEVNVRGLKCTGKKLKSGSTEESKRTLLAKLSQEALIHSQQRHPNIIQLLGVSLHPELTVITEYCPFNLPAFLDGRKQGTIPEWMKTQLMLDISQGLRYLHYQRQPIVHHGLTSNNVLLSEHLQAKIADLSTSRVFFDASSTNLDYGSFIFMPPELFLPDRELDFNVKFDIFSFGCIMIHILSQQYPIPSEQYVFLNDENDANTVNQSALEFVQVSEWKRRQDYLSHLPSEHSLRSIIEKCLANYPQDRPDSRELMNELKMAGPASPYPPSKGGVLLMLDELNSKETELRKAREERTKDCHQITRSDSLHNDEAVNTEKAVHSQADSSSNSQENQEIVKRNKIIVTQTQKISELEREAMVTDAVVKALEDVKTQNSKEITHLTSSCKKERQKRKAIETQFEELKKSFTNLTNEMTVLGEEQSRTDSILFNQQVQLESSQQCLSTARAANKSLEKRIHELQVLQESILDEQSELTDKYQSDVAALKELNNVHVLQRKTQDIKYEGLLMENKVLRGDLESMKAAFDETVVRIKKQQSLTEELLRGQEQKLAAINNVTTTPLYQQKKIVDSLMKQRLVKGDIWCLISCHWFEKWSKFIHIALNVGIDGINDSSHPGPVTSFMLIKFALPNFQPMRLKKNLVEDFDYKLIPEIAWDLLIQWYGISEKSTRLSRKVVTIRKHVIAKLMVEVYPLTVLIMLASPGCTDDDKINYEVSRNDTVAFVIEKLREMFDVPPIDESRLWLQHLNDRTLLSESDTMGENKSSCSVEDNDVLILEVKKDGKWVYETPRAAGKYHYEVTLPMSRPSPDSDPDYEVMEPPPHTTL